jgi:hypothetical protein
MRRERDREALIVTEHFTDTQRTILLAMSAHETGLAIFTGSGSRRLGFGIREHANGGIIFRVYGSPEFFLRSRGLIKQRSRIKTPDRYWYTLTERGRDAAAEIRRKMKVGR